MQTIIRIVSHQKQILQRHQPQAVIVTGFFCESFIKSAFGKQIVVEISLLLLRHQLGCRVEIIRIAQRSAFEFAFAHKILIRL